MVRKLYTESVLGKAFALFVLVIPLSACEQEQAERRPPRLAYATRVADTSGLSERTFPGRARAGQEVNLSFRVAGPLITFPADVGDEVKAGDVMARIDPHDYETRVRTVEAQVEREEARKTRASVKAPFLPFSYSRERCLPVEEANTTTPESASANSFASRSMSGNESNPRPGSSLPE